ncbi:MAG: DNA polymerase III subunit alpha, partial [candidate division KSB1 bacterium]|nr:DNA polymerase III subunit alpha [candidate division KSB1 bacterium]
GYSLVAYQTAYLKAHYPAEFMAANMTSEMNNTSRIVILMEECRRMGIKVLPPDINTSNYEFTVVGKDIRFGLGAVKNVGKNAILSILEARAKVKSFKTIFDLSRHVDLRLVNKKVLESLILAGALDSLQGHRAQLLQSIDLATNYSQSFSAHHANGQTSMFDTADAAIDVTTPPLPEVKPFVPSEQLAHEKEMLGFYFSGHPLSRYQLELKHFSKHPLDSIHELPDKAIVKSAVVVTSVKKHFDRKNRPMAFVNVEDLTGAAEMIVFADAYEKYQSLLQPDTMVLLIGKVSSKGDSEENKILCDELIPLSEVWDRCVKHIRFSINTDTTNDQFIRQIKEILSQNHGQCPVYINIKTPQNGEYVFRSRRILAQPSPALVNELATIVGMENISIES